MSNIFFVSLGCDKNLVDSEIMLGIIDEEGHTITTMEEEADIIIINTCGFIMDASQESVENILQLASLKDGGRCQGLIVTGCMAERYKEEIFKELPEVDAVVGTGDFEKIADIIKEVLDGSKVTMVTDKNKKLSEDLSHKRILTTPGHFAYLKIAEGCDNFCTYCTIPSIRGKYRSRDINGIIKEAEILAGKGVKELILVAQDTSLYGTDIYNENKLHELLKKLSLIENIEWIRILYCYPEHLTDETIVEMAQNPKVCHYLDMPIQHSEDKILKLMGRKSSKEKIREIIKKLRKKIPDICLRTTLIVGFPYEDEEDFKNLSKFIKEIEFDRLGVFAYSKEEGTKAHEFPNQVDEDIKEFRKNSIMELQSHISKVKLKKQVGKTLKVIVEGKIPEEDIYCGRSYMDCYEVDGMVFFKSDYEIITGEFLNILISESSEYDLTGDIV